MRRPLKVNICYQDEQLSHRAKAVYLYLRDRADPQGICWPALGTIARELSLSRSTVKRAVRVIEDREEELPSGTS